MTCLIDAGAFLASLAPSGLAPPSTNFAAGSSDPGNPSARFAWVPLMKQLATLRSFVQQHLGRSAHLKRERYPALAIQLSTCAQLRVLHLGGSHLTDAQLCEILPHLDSMLERMPHLHTLQFLASSPHLPTTLTDLRLVDVHLPRDEFLSPSCPV